MNLAEEPNGGTAVLIEDLVRAHRVHRDLMLVHQQPVPQILGRVSHIWHWVVLDVLDLETLVGRQQGIAQEIVQHGLRLIYFGDIRGKRLSTVDPSR
jgi:hypothetical protein